MPNRTNLTQLAVDRIGPPPSGRVVYWDKNLPGFGLRVSAPRPGSREGRKTWVAMGRVGPKAVMETIGTLAQIPKVDKARDLARVALLRMRSGARPVDDRRAERERREAEKAATEAAAAEAVQGRFAAVAERFLSARDAAKGWAPKYAAEFRRIINHDVLPAWGERPIRSITKPDVNKLLDAKAKGRERARKGTEGGAATQANRTLTRLRTLFAWAVANDLIDSDPTAGVSPRVQERTRDRVLTDSEIVSLWAAAEQAGWPYGPIFRLLLLTAQRESEVAGMRWAELDLDKRLWTLPRERTKSDRGHVVHLSDAAAEIIAALPRLGDLVFPTRTGRQIAGFGKAKERLDATMTAQLRKATARHDAEVEPWVIHDLRRTATTIMARLNVAPHVADRVLNHSAGTIHGVAATYNRFQYLNERKAALEALGHFVETLVNPGAAGNVVALPVAKGRRMGKAADTPQRTPRTPA
ncbi:MAG TPA: tyrosine-type recombinase/integrase, partial [Stellaceae bacterium]|nr:tyrosine-type recombinase/integrase [Stellaceae bacterium]